jgi:uncharacterized membrane protein (DUF485 family)
VAAVPSTPEVHRTQEVTMNSSADDSTHNGADNGGALPPPTPTEARYIAVQGSPEFQDLRKRYRGWVIPVTLVSLAWYFVYVLLAAYAHDFMGQKVYGNINVGLILGLAQFVTTFAVTSAYVRFAGRALDPASERIRDKMEQEGLL